MMYSPSALALLLLSSITMGGVSGQCGREKTCRSFKNHKISDQKEYYSSTAGLTGAELKAELNSIIRGHSKYSYDCVWTAIAEADADPEDPERVIGLYSRRSMAKRDRVGGCGNGNDGWNREHLWAKSHGFPNKSQHAYTDIHHLFVADASVNSKGRNNYDFQSGGVLLSTIDSSKTCATCRVDTNRKTFEPPDVDNVKGQVARSMFYMDTRYEGGDNTRVNDLILVDEQTYRDETNGRLGYVSELLEWHCKFPVTQRECKRNDIVQKWQSNRNPFVDRPDFVEKIWGEQFPEIFKNCKVNANPCLSGGGTTEPDKEKPPVKPPTPPTDPVTPPTSPTDPVTPPSPTNAAVWINEFHYDDAGRDDNEFIEIGCNQEIDLDDYSIVLYNGKNRRLYDTAELSGVCSPPNNFVVQKYSVQRGIQNGGPDGIALVDDNDEVVEFISYEGSFNAGNGPAEGMTSVDIGVSESNRSSAGNSLQLVGTGCERSDFTWLKRQAPSSEGGVNKAQRIVCAVGNGNEL